MNETLFFFCLCLLQEYLILQNVEDYSSSFSHPSYNTDER